jgi:hypothetical protein
MHVSGTVTSETVHVFGMCSVRYCCNEKRALVCHNTESAWRLMTYGQRSEAVRFRRSLRSVLFMKALRENV